MARLLPLAERARAELLACRAVERCEIAGSLRRFGETAKDIDLVAAVTNRVTATEAFVDQEWVAEVRVARRGRCTAVAHDGTRVELRMVPPAQLREPAAAPDRLEGRTTWPSARRRCGPG